MHGSIRGFLRNTILLAGSLSLALAASVSSANVVYTYTGNNFTGFQYGVLPPGEYDTSMSVSGWFEVADAFVAFHSYNIHPLAYSFTDGRNVLSSASPPGFAYFELTVDGAGQINFWNIQLRDEPTESNIRQIMTGSSGPGSGQDSGLIQVSSPFVQGDDGYVNFAPGTWTISESSAVPEPETAALLLAGLLGLAARRKRQTRPS